MERIFTGRELVNTSSRLERNAATVYMLYPSPKGVSSECPKACCPNVRRVSPKCLPASGLIPKHLTSTWFVAQTPGDHVQTDVMFTKFTAYMCNTCDGTA